MRARLTKLGAGLAALTALGVGGAQLASAAGSGSQAGKAPAAAEQASAKDDVSEPAGGAEKRDAETAESGGEVADDDGPGGWADEPGNPNADTQQQGEH